MASRPNTLLTALVATTVMVTVALAWAGWRLLVQQGAIDEQRRIQQLDATAAGIVADVREGMAAAGERLSGSLASQNSEPASVESGVVILVQPDAVRVSAPRGLPFVPVIQTSPPVDSRFDAAEALEFGGRDLRQAATAYRALAAHQDADVRAAALMRLGRVLRKSGDFSEALVAYQTLAGFEGRRVGDLPAGLVGLYGQRAALRGIGDAAHEAQITGALREALDSGRWPLTRGAAEFYRDEIGLAERPHTWALADAIDRTWTDAGGTLAARGLRVFTGEPRVVLVMWRVTAGRTAMMAAFADEFLRPAVPADARWQLADASGARIAGVELSDGPTAIRIVGDADYPWTLQVAAASPRTPAVPGSQATILAMMAAMLVFVWGATYFMSRAIRREASFARLQTDFVAAVSHEFRSPLTAIRQMTEMLNSGRLHNETRRAEYYRVLVNESARLQRLVETLLDFGRLEAGGSPYTFAEIDAAVLARTVVGEVEPLARAAGKEIETAGIDEGLLVRADRTALALALRNLIDNAIKYSPGAPSVRVEWDRTNNGATIRVIDRGVGIPDSERKTIFRKFVRGQSALDGNVRGTGVGLSMVEQIVAAHGGEIRVDSEVGRGSTFTVMLPSMSAT